MYVWKKKVCIQLRFNGRSMYGAETSLWSIGGENARLILSLLRRNINSKVDFREKLSKVLRIKSRTVDRRKLRRTGKCYFISIFPLVVKLMTQIASMFSVKYVCRLNSSPKASLDRQNQQNGRKNNGSSLQLDDIIADTNRYVNHCMYIANSCFCLAVRSTHVPTRFARITNNINNSNNNNNNKDYRAHTCTSCSGAPQILKLITLIYKKLRL